MANEKAKVIVLGVIQAFALLAALIGIFMVIAGAGLISLLFIVAGILVFIVAAKKMRSISAAPNQ